MGWAFRTAPGERLWLASRLGQSATQPRGSRSTPWEKEGCSRWPHGNRCARGPGEEEGDWEGGEGEERGDDWVRGEVRHCLGEESDQGKGRCMVCWPHREGGTILLLGESSSRFVAVRQKAAGPERSGSPLSREPDERTQRGRGEGNERAGGTWQRIDSRADYRVTLRNTRGRGEKERRREEGC